MRRVGGCELFSEWRVEVAGREESHQPDVCDEECSEIPLVRREVPHTGDLRRSSGM